MLMVKHHWQLSLCFCVVLSHCKNEKSSYVPECTGPEDCKPDEECKLGQCYKPITNEPVHDNPNPVLDACTDDRECQKNNLFCDGTERCIGNKCTTAVAPCDPQKQTCDEAHDLCVNKPLDSTPPGVEIKAPLDYQIVSKTMTITVTIQGENKDSLASVKALIQQRYEVDLSAEGTATTYSGKFDTTVLDPTMLYPALEVIATDISGNIGVHGISFAVDNEPPVMTLKRHEMQVGRIPEPDKFECSTVFKPLGGSAVNHGDRIESPYLGIVMRARIEDRGNGYYYDNIIYPIAGNDDKTIFVYLLDSVALNKGKRLVLGNNSGVCNRISPEVEPDVLLRKPEQAYKQDMVPVAPAGVAYFSKQVLPLNAACQTPGTEEKKPPSICAAVAPGLDTDISLWISYTYAKKPAIYVLGEYNPASALTCTGGAFDAKNLADGPVCIAVIATDLAGNSSVSEPIAICVDKDNNGNCLGFSPNDIKCTDGCLAPSSIDDFSNFYLLF